MKLKLYYFYYINPQPLANGLFDNIHLKCLEYFNYIWDECNICIAIDDIDDEQTIHNTQQRFIDAGLKNISFSLYKNDPDIREVEFFRSIIINLNNNDDLIFFAHNKGNSWYNDNYAVINWILALYYFNLNRIWDVKEKLNSGDYDVYGSFMVSGWMLFPDNPNDYFIGGTYMWFKDNTVYNILKNISVDTLNNIYNYNERWFAENFFACFSSKERCYVTISCGPATDIDGDLYKYDKWKKALTKEQLYNFNMFYKRIVLDETYQHKIQHKDDIISLCVKVRRENRYIREFVEYYKSIGFDRIYLFDNNWPGEDDLHDVIQDYIDSNYVIVEKTDLPIYDVYNDCMCYHQNDRFIAFFDADEFLYLGDFKNIHDFVNQDMFKDTDIIKFVWKIYDDNDQIYYEDKPLQERFPRQSEKNNNELKKILRIYSQGDSPVNAVLKTMCKPNINEYYFSSPHALCQAYDKCKYANGNDTVSSFWADINAINNTIYLKHYITKSLEEYVQNRIGIEGREYDASNWYDINRYFIYNKITNEKVDYLYSLNLFQNKEKCCIVIPIYKNDPTDDEIESLKQCIKIFGTKYDIYLVRSTSVTDDRSYYDVVDNYHFKPIELDFYDGSYKSYNDMCLDRRFYFMFLKYEYMLIYQLDAWVFEDKLDYFIDMGYDYYGSPWPYTYTDQDKFTQDYLLAEKKTGNGGLSLRKTDVMYNICKEQQPSDLPEDVFFSYKAKDLNIAPVEIAEQFSLEIKPELFINNNELPMGAHAYLNEAFRYDKIDYLKDIKPITIALCANVRLENLYIREWVEYYKKLAFDHIFLYDNNKEGEDNLLDVIQDYVDEGFVEIIKFNHKIDLRDPYQDCNDRCIGVYDWVACFDADEFLVLGEFTNVHTYLRQDMFKDTEMIHFNWIMYGDNDQIYYEDKPVLERFTKPSDNTKFNTCIKSIVKAQKKVDWIHSVNNHSVSDNSLVRRMGNGVLVWAGSFDHNISDNKYYIKHIYTKSLEEYCNKINKYINGGHNYKFMDSRYVSEYYSFDKYFEFNERTQEKENYIANHYSQENCPVLIKKSILGRIGNILFEFACLKHFQIKNKILNKNTYYVIQYDKDFNDPRIANMSHYEYLKYVKEINKFFNRPLLEENIILVDNISNIITNNYATLYYDENTEITFEPNYNIIIDGWRMTDYYWNNDKQFIYDTLKLDENIINYTKDYFKDIDFSKYCGIAVRTLESFEIGIYNINLFDESYFNFINKNYLNSNGKFIITSNNCDEARKRYQHNCTVLEYKEDKYPKYIIDFAIQTLCANNILTGSTFSWWASYMNKNENAKVYHDNQITNTLNKDFYIKIDNWINIKPMLKFKNDNKEVLISIIIACYNSSIYIEQLMDSLVNQDIPYDEFEVILVDDQSTDNWQGYIDKYDDKLNIKYYETSKDAFIHGPGQTRNVGLKHANGKWIMFIDHDDRLEYNVLGEVKKILSENKNKDFITTNYNLDYGNGDVVKFKFWQVQHGDFYKKEFLDKYNIIFSDILFSHEDVYFSTCVYLFGSFYASEYATYHWHQHPQQLSKSDRYENCWYGAFNSVHRACQKYISYFPENKERCLHYYVQDMMYKLSAYNEHEPIERKDVALFGIQFALDFIRIEFGLNKEELINYININNYLLQEGTDYCRSKEEIEQRFTQLKNIFNLYYDQIN